MYVLHVVIYANACFSREIVGFPFLWHISNGKEQQEKVNKRMVCNCSFQERNGIYFWRVLNIFFLLNLSARAGRSFDSCSQNSFNASLPAPALLSEECVWRIHHILFCPVIGRSLLVTDCSTVLLSRPTSQTVGLSLWWWNTPAGCLPCGLRRKWCSFAVSAFWKGRRRGGSRAPGWADCWGSGSHSCCVGLWRLVREKQVGLWGLNTLCLCFKINIKYFIDRA